MNIIGNYSVAKRAGWIALVGGVFQLIYGLMAVFFPYSSDTYYGWDEGLWLVANIGMAGAIVGIIALDAGTPGWLARFGGTLAIVGVLTRSLASVLIIIKSPWYPLPLILSAILLMLVGMFALGIAILRGDKLNGWQAWTPIFVSIFGLIVAAIYSVDLFIHYITLGLWGVSWMLVGYVAISSGTDV